MSCYTKNYLDASFALRQAMSIRVDTKYIVYVLLCRNKTFYIGITTNLPRRIIQHFIGQGSKWTKYYQPIEIYRICPTNDKSYEKTLTQEFINIFGNDKVRGADYCCCEKRPSKPRARVFWDNKSRWFGIRLKNDFHLDEALPLISRLNPIPVCIVQNKDLKDDEKYTQILLP